MALSFERRTLSEGARKPFVGGAGSAGVQGS